MSHPKAWDACLIILGTAVNGVIHLISMCSAGDVCKGAFLQIGGIDHAKPPKSDDLGGGVVVNLADGLFLGG